MMSNAMQCNYEYIKLTLLFILIHAIENNDEINEMKY